MKTVFADKIPSTVISYFASEGLETDRALVFLRFDVCLTGAFGECFVALFGDKFAIAEGYLTFSSAGKRPDGLPRRAEDFRVTRYAEFKLEDIGEPKAEQLISTGRVTAKCGEEEQVLFNYSSACKHGAGVFCRAVSELKKNGELKESDFADENYEKHVCPKCGRRYPDDELKVCPNCMDKAKLVRRLAKQFTKYKYYILIMFVAYCMTAALGIATPYIANEMLYDDVLTNPASVAFDVVRIVLLIVAVRVGSLVVNLITGAASATVAAKVTYDVKKTIFNTISDLSLGFFTNRQTGGLMTQVNSDSLTLYWFFCDGFPYLVLNIIQLAVVVAVMFTQNLALALYTFISIPVFFLAFKYLFRIFDKLHAKRYSRRRSFNSLVSDVLNGMRVVKSFSREDEEMRRFGEKSGAAAQATYELESHVSRVYPLLYYVLRIGSYVVWAVGGIQVMNAAGDMSYGRLMAFVAYFALIYGPIEQLADVTNWWSESLNAFQRLFEITDAQPDVREAENPVIPESPRGEVEFKNVSFSYVKNRKVIDGVSFTVPAGTMLGIVGKTGAGKSTLANLLTRLYDVKEGEVLIDGVNIKKIPFAYLRESVAIVSQETYLFRGSILENIRYARPEATREEVIAAAKTASAHDFIVKMPDGYDTQIGMGLKELSGGEKQRVSIARAILRDPRILILDEATAAMDTQTERSIQHALDKLTEDRTTVVIAHRLSTLRNADSLIALEDGKVAESGTAEELLKQKGVYYKLYKMQAEALKTVGIE